MARPIPLALAALLAPAAASAAPDCFDAGLAALDARRFADAAAAFEAATRRPDCAADAVDLEFNRGFALQRLAAGGEADAACQAVAAYRRVVAATTDPDLARTARDRISKLQPTCAPPVEDRGLSWPVRSAIAAGAVAVATGVVYGLALHADGERAEAREDYVARRRAGDAAGAEAARARFTDARDRTDAMGYTAYVGLGLTVALSGLAIGGFIATGDGPTVAVGPRGLSVRGRW